MRKIMYTLLIMLLPGAGAYAQFPLTPVQWPTPQGGFDYENHGNTRQYGFFYTSGQFGVTAYGSQVWSLQDMNGDGKPDLVITSYMDSANNLFPIQFGADSTPPHWLVYLNTGTDFASTPVVWPTPQGGLNYESHGSNYTYGFNTVNSSYVLAYYGAQAWQLQDMNGDGKPDLVVTGYVDSANNLTPIQFGASSSPYWYVYLNTGAGFDPVATIWPTPVGGIDGEKYGTIYTYGYGTLNGTEISAVNGAETWNVVDVNGDGKPDLVITGALDSANNYQTTQFGVKSNNPHWKVYLNTGSAFSLTATQWPTPYGGANEENLGLYDTAGFNQTTAFYSGAGNGFQSWGLQDMDGDGKPDLVVVAVLDSGTHYNSKQFAADSANPYWLVYLNNGSGFSTTSTQWPTPKGGGDYQYTTYSMNEGFNIFQSYYSPAYHGAQIWKLLDINGDNKPDLVVTSYIDSAGDGEVQFSANSNPYWLAYLNTGSGFSTTATQWTTPMGGVDFDTAGVSYKHGFIEYTAFYQNGPYTGAQSWDLVDMNGDGKPDLVVTAAIDSANFDFATQYGLPSNPYWNVYLNGTSVGLHQITSSDEPCKLFPNPNTGNFALQFTDATERTIEIYDVMGRLIMQPVNMQNQQQFNLGNISAGIYLLRYTQNDEVKSLKFVVEK